MLYKFVKFESLVFIKKKKNKIHTDSDLTTKNSSQKRYMQFIMYFLLLSNEKNKLFIIY